MAVREVLSALGKFDICQGKVRDFQNPPAVATMTALCVLFFSSIVSLLSRAAERRGLQNACV